MKLENLLEGGKRFLRSTVLPIYVAASIVSCSNDPRGNACDHGGCSGGNGGGGNNSPQEEEETHVLDDYDLQQITDVDGNTLVFSYPMDLEVGNVIAAGISDMTPNGLLRRITEASDDKTIFQTEQSNLEDAINNLQSNYLRNGATNYLEELTISFDLPLISIDQDIFSTLYESELGDVTLSGNFSLDSYIYLYSKFGERLENFLLGVTVDESAEIDVSSSLFSDLNIEKTLIEFDDIPSFWVPLPTTPPIPIVFKPVVEIFAGVEGGISPTRARVKQNLYLNGYLNYGSGNWSSSFDSPQSILPIFFLPETPDSLNFRAYAGSKIKLLLYGSAGPNVDANANLRLEADESSWSLNRGLGLSVGAEMKMFGKQIVDYSKEVLSKEWLVKNGSTIPPTTIDILPSQDAYIQLGTYQNLGYNTDTLSLWRESVTRESLIQFSLNSIPQDSEVVSAKLGIYGSCGRNINAPITVNVKKILNSWNESSVSDRPNYSSTIYSALDFPDSEPSTHYEMNITSLVREWISGAASNQGLALVLGDPNSECTFRSSEHSDSSLRPKLTVSYR